MHDLLDTARRPLGDGAMPYLPYRSAVTDAVVALDLHAPQPADFRGALAACTRGDAHVYAIAADAHSVHRTDALIARDPQQFLKFTVLEHGTAMIVQDGRESLLGEGDMTVYDTARPYSLVCGEDVRMSVVMFPRAVLSLPADGMRRVTATRWDGTAGVGAILRPYVTSLARQVGELDAHTGRRLCRGAIDLVATLLEGAVAQTAPRAQDGVLRRMFDYIDDHLGAPDLAPAEIAAAHFVSVRHLHALFREQGTTVSTVIRNRRLERCYDQLLDPQAADRSVTAIAFDNGFTDPSHFSRTFRSHFGMPPSALRRDRG